MLRIAGWNYSRAISKTDHCVFGLQSSAMHKCMQMQGKVHLTHRCLRMHNLFRQLFFVSFGNALSVLQESTYEITKIPGINFEKSIKS